MQYNRTVWQVTLPSVLLSENIREGRRGSIWLNRRLGFAFHLIGDSVISSLVILKTFKDLLLRKVEDQGKWKTLHKRFIQWARVYVLEHVSGHPQVSNAIRSLVAHMRPEVIKEQCFNKLNHLSLVQLNGAII